MVQICTQNNGGNKGFLGFLHYIASYCAPIVVCNQLCSCFEHLRALCGGINGGLPALEMLRGLQAGGMSAFS